MTIRQRDLQSALRALRAEGVDVDRVELTRDGAVVYARRAGAPEPQDEAEAWLKEQENTR